MYGRKRSLSWLWRGGMMSPTIAILVVSLSLFSCSLACLVGDVFGFGHDHSQVSAEVGGHPDHHGPSRPGSNNSQEDRPPDCSVTQIAVLPVALQLTHHEGPEIAGPPPAAILSLARVPLSPGLIPARPPAPADRSPPQLLAVSSFSPRAPPHGCLTVQSVRQLTAVGCGLCLPAFPVSP